MTALAQSGREEAIATGLLELDADGTVVRDTLTRLDDLLLMPGQRIQVRRDDPRVADLVTEDRLQLISQLPTPRWWDAEGRILMTEPGAASVMASEPSAGSLRIVQGTGYDPGAAAFRTHTALNECSPHTSAFVRYLTSTNNPHGCPTQYAVNRETIATVRALLLSADIIHCHIDPILTRNAGFPARPRPSQIIVRHYHGTQFTGADTVTPDEQQAPVKNAEQDDRDGYVLVGARLQVCALRPGRIHWLPIPMPVSRYAAMSEGRRSTAHSRFRIAHSPTRRRLKGTAVLESVVRRLQSRGLPIDLLMIENISHAAALQLKATADLCFDSFALGLQGSGLESAAMGQPVIAGDPYVRDLHIEQFGYCPYTFAGSEAELSAQIERLITDQSFYAEEAARVGAYCREYHDYAAVAARYSNILREAS